MPEKNQKFFTCDQRMNRLSEKAAPSLLQVNLSTNLVVFNCIADENKMTVTFVKEEEFRSPGETVLSKLQTFYNGAEIEAGKK